MGFKSRLSIPAFNHAFGQAFGFGTLVLALPILASAAAKDVRFKEIPLDLKDGDRLVISGLEGSVRLASVASGKPALLRVQKTLGDKAGAEAVGRFEALSFVVRRDGSQVFIEVKGPDSKAAWAAWMKPSAIEPKLAMEIEAPSLPAEIAMRSGQIQVQGWKQPLVASLIEGTVRTTATEGPLKIQIQKGEVKIDSHRGDAELDSNLAKVTAQDVEGHVTLTNFGGDTALTNLKGHVDLRVHAGAVNVAKATGSVEFLVGRGTLNVANFEGALRGETIQGAVNAVVEGETDVAIASDEGPVSVRLPASSGAAVRLKTDEGQISGPESLPGTGSDKKVLVGRLSGSGAKGSVTVQSKSGLIRVR